MAKLIDSLTWIQNGERGEATVYNRALKQLVTMMDNAEIQSASSVQGFTVDPLKIDASVTDGMVVYIGLDGIFYPSLGSDEDKSNIIGVYKLINNVPTIQTGGVISFLGTYPGVQYYLSLNTPGGITAVASEGTIQIASAIASDSILLTSIGGGSSGSSSGSSIAFNPTLVDSSD